MWRAAKPVRAGTSAAMNLIFGGDLFKRCAAKHGSEADPGTSPTAAGWVCGTDGAGMPKKNKKNYN